MRRSLPSLRPAAFPPHPPPPTWSALFGASSVLLSRPPPPAFRGGFALLSFPPRPKTAWAAAGDSRSPRFRRDPFVRELVSDPGRATVPRIAAPPHVAFGALDRLGPCVDVHFVAPYSPHTIAVYASPWSSPSTPQHSLQAGATPYLGRTLTGWTAPASPGAPKNERRGGRRQKIFRDIYR